MKAEPRASTVLLLGYFFPPIGGAGAQRNTKLAKLLPQLGRNLTVVTGSGAGDGRWLPRDETLSRDVDPSVKILRIETPEPSRRDGLRRRGERWLRLPSAWSGWWERHAVPLAVEGGNDADVVYASLAPFSTARAAIRVSKRLGKPLVLDLEDPWALDEMLSHESGLHARLELRSMRRALRAADAIVMNTPEAAARVRDAFPELGDTPLMSIVNGYDADDFDVPPSERDDQAFRIVHTGSLHQWAAKRSVTRRLLGGTTSDLDMLTRSLTYLLQALDALMLERPELRGRVEVHLAGRITDGDRAAFAGRPYLHEHGFLPHDATVALAKSADLLFLPMHELPPGRRVAIVPCKTYEYLATRRPILAAVPDGDARDLLAAAGNAYLCRPSDALGIRDALAEAIDRKASGLPAVSPAGSILARIERRALTRDLASFLDEVVAARSSAGRAVGTRRVVRESA